jgi:two-component system, LytTR family, response regulator
MRVVIVDDEPLARSRLVHLCHEQADLQVVAQAATGADAIQAIKAHQPDLVLLDVELQDMTGFDVLRSLQFPDGPLAIMVTAHPEHAMRAFESDAVHYLAKPVDSHRLGNAITRARTRLSLDRTTLDRATLDRTPPDRAALDRTAPGRAALDNTAPDRTNGAASGPLRQITGEKSRRLYFIDVETIDYLESDANYVTLHVGDEHYLARNTLKYLASALSSLGFVRIERSILLNLRRVAFAERLDRGAFVFTMRNGQRLVSSSTYRKGIVEEIRRGQFASRPGAH